jgi:hypothetical protein
MASSSFFALSRFIGDEVKGSNKPPLLKPRLLAQPGFLFFKSYRRPGDIPNAHSTKVSAASTQYMVILLDLDGVLITTPAWRAVETDPDGFFKFNERATANLAAILTATNAAVVLTTSHRINYSLAQWTVFFRTRGLFPSTITRVNDRTSLPKAGSRVSEIAAWVTQPGAPANYVVLDDDLSLHGLPAAIKSRCVFTKPLIGLDADATQRVLHILCGYTTPTIL